MPVDKETQRLIDETRERRKQAAEKGRAKSRGETISEPEQTTGEQTTQPDQPQTSGQ